MTDKNDIRQEYKRNVKYFWQIDIPAKTTEDNKLRDIYNTTKRRRYSEYKRWNSQTRRQKEMPAR